MMRYIYDETTGDTIYPEDVGGPEYVRCRCPLDSPCECPRQCARCERMTTDVDGDGVCERCSLEDDDDDA